MLIDLLESSKAIGLCPMGRWQFCCHQIWFKAYTFVIQNTHKLRLLLCNFFLPMKQYLATYRLLPLSVDVLM